MSSNIAAVQYANTFVVMASANPVPYHINYEANTEDKVSGMPENGDGKTDTGLFVLPSNNPKRDNYRFIGWCDGETSVENGVDICDKATYQPEDNYGLTTKDEEITLLAMWAEDSKIMQNWKGCDSLNYSTRNNPQEITLIDARDNKMYYVAKLADGRCWMTENLDLDIDSNRTYTVADTDLAYATDDDKGSSVDEDGNYQWKPEKSTYSTGTISNDLSDYNARSYDVGNYCWKSETITSDRTPGLQPGSPEFGEFAVACVKHQAVVGSDPHYHLGNYYNYGAAVAQNDTSKKTEQYDKYETSICPSGWQLPTREDDGIATFQKVINAAITEEARAIGYEAIKGGKEMDGGNVHLAPYYYIFAGYWRGSVGKIAR